MKVLIPFAYYYPEQCAGIYIVHDLMDRLATEGHEVLLVCPSPTRNVDKSVRAPHSEVLSEGRIRIIRFPMYGEGKNTVMRAIRYCLCEAVYLWYMLTKRYDVAFIDSTPPIQGLKLPIVRFFRRKPIVYNAQDLFPDTLSGTGLAKQGGLAWKIGTWVSKVTFNNSDRIIAISNDIAKNIIGKGVSENKVSVIYNWSDTGTIIPIDRNENPLYDELGISKDKFTVVYAGNLGNAQNINIIMEAATKLVHDNDIRFLIFGCGGMEEDIKEYKKRHNLTNLNIFPLQPPSKVAMVYGLGDLCVVSCKPGLGKAAMPSKTWSIMSSGSAVLASFDEGELKDIITKNRCGIFTPAGDAEAFTEAILQAKLGGECNKMGQRGRKFVEDNLTKEQGTLQYKKILENTVYSNKQ